MVKVDTQSNWDEKNSFIFQNRLFLTFFSSVNGALTADKWHEGCIYTKIPRISSVIKTFFQFPCISKK